jgi:hypothetical protein
MLSRGYDIFNGPIRFLSFFLDSRLQVPSPCRVLVHDFLLVRYSRSLHGALKGIIGVTKCAMAELTDETNIARGFSSLQFAWIVGYVIGLAIIPIVPLFR